MFGWTEKNDLKSSLESIVITNNVNDSIIPIIEQEIRDKYIIKDWKKFDNLTVEPPTWAYIVYFSILIIFHGLFYLISISNKLGKYWKSRYDDLSWDSFWTPK